MESLELALIVTIIIAVMVKAFDRFFEQSVYDVNHEIYEYRLDFYMNDPKEFKRVYTPINKASLRDDLKINDKHFPKVNLAKVFN